MGSVIGFIVMLLALTGLSFCAQSTKCFPENDCTCIADPSSATVLKNVTCIALNATTLNPFTGSVGTYTVTGQIQIVVQFGQKFSVPANAFKVFKSINHLYFRNIPWGVAYPLNLDPKAFAGTQIDELELDMFGNPLPLQEAVRSLANLKKLSLTDRDLKKISADQFQGFSKLSSLYIGAPINTVDDNAFTGLEKSLTELVIKGGQIWPTEALTFPEKATKGLKKLQLLGLSFVYVETFPDRAFARFPDLRDLDLSTDNVTKALSVHAFDGISPKLERLTLDQGSLNAIPADLLANLPNLSFLSMQLNTIRAIRVGDIPKKNKIITLKLDSGFVRTIEAGALSPLKLVRDLQFYRQTLETFDFSLLDGMEKLENLTINDYYTRPGGYLKNVFVSAVDKVPSTLKHISISSRILPTIDPTLENIAKRKNFQLLTIDLLSNYGFQCDESLKWITKYVFCSPRRVHFQNANCGGSARGTVEDYLKKLVPNPCT